MRGMMTSLKAKHIMVLIAMFGVIGAVRI